MVIQDITKLAGTKRLRCDGVLFLRAPVEAFVGTDRGFALTNYDTASRFPLHGERRAVPGSLFVREAFMCLLANKTEESLLQRLHGNN